jgi:Phage capsid family.
MEEKDLKALQATIKEEVKNLSDAQKAFETASELKREELAVKMAKYDENIEKLSKQADAIQLAQKDQISMGRKENPYAEMKKTMADKSVIEELKKGGQRTFEIKVSDIALNNELGNAAVGTSVVLPFREAGIVQAPDRMVRLLDIINRANINSNRVSWVERTARTNGISTNATAAVAEEQIFPQSDFTWNQKYAPVEKIATYVKVTNEALEDWDQLMNAIQNELLPMVERALELMVYSGTGVSPQMQGITDTGIAAAFTASAMTGIVTPNLIDVITAAVAQIRVANFDGPLTALVNSYDYAMATMPKNADGIYLMPPNFSGDRMSVNGCRIVQSSLVTEGDILVGDFTKDTLFTKRGIEIKVWDQNSDDPIHDLKTITASVRAVNRLALPNYDAFVYDAIGDIVTAIS